MIFRIAAAVLVIAGAVAVPAPAYASDDVRWSVQPSTAKGPDGRDYVIRKAAPGERITDYVGITNLTAKPITFTVYGTDAYNTTDGSFALLPAASQPTDIGSWISLGLREYTVPANTRLDVPFAIDVPASATPGDHAGGVIASVSQEQAGANGQKVLVDRRIAARVYLTVAGTVTPALSIQTVRVEYAEAANPASGGTMTVRYLVKNTGNLRLSGRGSVRVTGPFGWRLAGTSTMPLPELLPGGSVTITETILGVQPAVRLAASVTVEPDNFGTRLPVVSRGTGVWAWPWALVALLAVGVAYLVLVLIRRSRLKRRAASAVTAA